MEFALVLVVGLLIGGAVGAVVGRTTAAPAVVEATGPDPELLQAQHANALGRLQHEAALAKAEVERQLAAAQAEMAGVREQLEQVKQQYRDTVADHRRQDEERRAGSAAESAVLERLAPVADQLKAMQTKVTDLEKQRTQQHGQLAEQLRASHESAERSRQAADTLSRALRNNAVRGAYGEIQLTSLVESAGLMHRVDYSVQESITADSGARRPDMVIKLPGNKQMAIDAKVPYNSFIDAHDESLDDARRKTLMTDHARAVRKHVDQLSVKEYWSGLPNSPEFTVAFIPSDAILNAAIDADPTLMDYAFTKGIVLATPVNLWAALKTVAFTWRQESLAENAQELVDLGRTLYKRLATLSDHVAKLGRSLERSVNDYNKFVGSLESQVLSTARKLDRVDDVALLATVPEIDADPRALRASEMTAALEMEALGDVDRPEIEPAIVDPQTTGAEQAG